MILLTDDVDTIHILIGRATRLADDADTREAIQRLARDLKSNLYSLLHDGVDWLDTVQLVLSRLDLEPVVDAPVNDPNHPAWDRLLAWREVAAPVRSMG